MGQEEKPWFYRLQMVANIMIARRKDGMAQKMLADKMKCTQLYMSSESITPEDVGEIKCKGK